MIITNGALIIIYLYINKRHTEETWMKELKSMVELMQMVKYSLRIVWTSLSARKCISRAHKHVRALRTKDGANVLF